MKRFLAIGFIWLGCAIAWMVLGATIKVRGGESSVELNGQVQLLWGPSIVQYPPTGRLSPHQPTNDAPLAPLAPPLAEPDQEDTAPATTPVRLDGSDIVVSLDLEQRRKGLLWFPTYSVKFSGNYTFRNPSDEAGEATLQFPLAGTNLVYDAFKVVDSASGQPVDANITDGAAAWSLPMEAGGQRTFEVVYRSRGTSSWSYGAPQNTAKIRNFALRMAVNSEEVDFPAGTISPSAHESSDDQWKGEWVFDSLITSAPIGVEMPKLLNPGPLAADVTFFAPVSLLFFFFLVAILAAAKHREIHPMNYFMLGCAFFAFHLLFAYMVDHVSVFTAFAISALMSMTLVTSYARLFVGWRFALLYMGSAQLVYLVMFLVHVLLERLHWIGGHHRSDPDAVRRHADDRPHGLATDLAPHPDAAKTRVSLETEPKIGTARHKYREAAWASWIVDTVCRRHTRGPHTAASATARTATSTRSVRRGGCGRRRRSVPGPTHRSRSGTAHRARAGPG